VIGAPMFIVSNPKLVIAQCTSGIVGAFPALNARPASALDEWLREITEALAAWNRDHPEAPSAPFAVNQIVHRSNDRFEHDMEVCARWKVPIVITSLGARVELNEAVHGWGGITLHDVIDDRFARKAIEKGADGIIAVAAGAGGHAGRWSPFALIQEIRAWFDGPLILSGAIANGGSILAAQAAGADLAYVGSPFIATEEANAPDSYKQAIVESGAADIVYTDLFTGVHGNYMRASIVNAGLDPDALVKGDVETMKFGSEFLLKQANILLFREEFDAALEAVESAIDIEPRPEFLQFRTKVFRTRQEAASARHGAPPQGPGGPASRR
jgi:nitronate monooxygenase